MNYLIYILFITVFTSEFIFNKIGINFKIISILAEIISIVASIYVLLYFALRKKAKIQGRYILFYSGLLTHIAIGIIGNFVQPLAIFAGMRLYFKFLPFYFLPMVYEFSNDQIEKQIKVLLFLAILQCPIALYQRFIEYRIASGDYIAGTLGTAPMLSLFLVATISMIVAFYLKKRIYLQKFIVLAVIAFLPTAINETKATFLLLPISIIIPTIFGVNKEKRLKILCTVIPVLIILVVSFHYMYKTFYSGRVDVMEFYTSEKITEYMYKSADANKIKGEEGEYGRIDSIILAYQANTDNFFRMIWGVGIGNAAVSFSKKFEGEYTDEYQRLGGKGTAVSHFIWEIGIFGILYIIWFFILIFYDSMKLKKDESVIGSIALGWLGVTSIAFLTLFYQNILAKDALVYTYFFFSGYISAKTQCH